MAHLSFEYSANLETALDLQTFSGHLRDAMSDTGVFPLGGIRVRGTRVDVAAIASGEDEIGFIDMTLRMGMGRDEAVRVSVTEAIYAAAEAWLKPQLGDRPFALSLEVMEIEPRFSERRFNTIHGFLKAGETQGG
ncbi:MAG: 5-carboxymethyl-2-hydroxymuconate isomerase [Candidatus Puniceispirillaceae bacterium]|jgi:5-carboxymethyl-2-hydroxymuconate isomerase